MSVLASLLSFALFEPAEVEPAPPFSLSWQAPSECMDREQALERVRELTPELPERVPVDGGSITVSVEMTDRKAIVRFEGPRGTDHRILEAQSCEVLARAVTVAIAVALADEVEAEVETPEDVPEPPPEEPELPPEPEPPPEEPPPETLAQPLDAAPTPKRRVRGHVGLLGGGGFGPLDTGMGAMVLELGAHGRWWRASARAVWIPPRTIALEQDPTLVGRYDGGSGGVRGCFSPPLANGRLELPLCAGFEAGAVRGRGVGTTPAPDTATQPWVAVGLGPGLRFVVNRWVTLSLEVDLLAAILRGGFTIDGLLAQSQAPIGVRALAGLELRFPPLGEDEDPRSRP